MRRLVGLFVVSADGGRHKVIEAFRATVLRRHRVVKLTSQRRKT
jgi:hypothetical protein